MRAIAPGARRLLALSVDDQEIIDLFVEAGAPRVAEVSHRRHLLAGASGKSAPTPRPSWRGFSRTWSRSLPPAGRRIARMRDVGRTRSRRSYGSGVADLT